MSLTRRFLKCINNKITNCRAQNNFFIRAFSSSHCIQDHVDIVIIGGGIMGTSTAYWTKKRAKHSLNILVLEKDLTYTHASTVLSVGGFRQQFSIPENIKMSQFGVDFVTNIQNRLNCDADVQFKPCGYLTLASEGGAATLEKNFKIQKENNVNNELLTVNRLNERFPWVNTEGIALGCFGLENEGWCDPWALLSTLKLKALELNVTYLKAEVVDFTFKDDSESLNGVVFKMNNDELKEVKFTKCVLTAGPSSGRIAELARIGRGEGILSVALPIEPRKRFVYCIECKADNAPCVNSPKLIDISGLWFRREGDSNRYIAGMSPLSEADTNVDDFELDYDYFDNEMWPILAHRVPAFESLKVKSGWTGHYEWNSFDQNGVIGPHPYHENLLIASGFSGHGLQHGIAVGRSLSELILDGKYVSINLERFGFDRLISNKPLIEANII